MMKSIKSCAASLTVSVVAMLNGLAILVIARFDIIYGRFCSVNFQCFYRIVIGTQGNVSDGIFISCNWLSS